MSHWKNLRHAYLRNARPRAAQREREAGVTLIEVTVPHQQATDALQALGAWLREAAHAS